MLTYEQWSKANKEAGGKGLRAQYDVYKADIEAGGDGSGSKVKGFLGKAGSGTKEQQTVGGQKSGSYGDDHPDAGNANTGDPYLDELRSGKVAGSEDWRRFSNAELKAMEPYYVGGGKFKNQYGDLVGKPQDSGPNTPKGFDGMGNPITGGGGRGRGGGGGGGRPGGGVPTGGSPGGDLALYQLKKTYADALADPTGQKAWQLFAGAGGARGHQSRLDQARQRIAGMPAGPARDAAERDLQKMRTESEVSMPQQSRQMALSGLSGVMQPELGYVGSERDRDLGWYGAKTDRMLGKGQLDLGWGGLGLQRELGMGDLGLRRSGQQFEQGDFFNWQKDEADKNRAHDLSMIDKQAKANKKPLWQTIGGMAAGILSDVRTKENIAPGRRGLTDLRKLGTYNYNYKGDPVKTPHQGVMAQDLEKVAPEMVTKDENGMKFVDGYGILSMTLKAVQELDKKIEKRRKERK